MAFVILISQLTTRKVKTIHIVTTEKKKLTKIGRAHEADMRVPDISVSRIHA